MRIVLLLLPFVFLFLIITFLFSRMGWKQLERDFLAVKKRFSETKRIGITSMTVNEVTYLSGVVVYVSKEGVLLKPMFFLKPTHRDLFIPWHNLSERRHIKSNQYRSYMVGKRFVTIDLPIKTCLAIEKMRDSF